MPEGKHKSRTMRRVTRKTPGGRLTVRFTLRKPQRPRCSQCGRLLPGVACERPTKLMNMAKTEKRPERPYGGVLCSECTRLIFKERARTQ